MEWITRFGAVQELHRAGPVFTRGSGDCSGVPTAATRISSMGLTSTLYKLARLSADIRAARSPTTLARRVKNKALGRLLARGGIWRRLWR